MPSQRININKFNKGTITAPDSKDIDLESASESLNVDGDVTPGKIIGIPTNGDAYQANGNVEIPDVRIGEFIENNGQYDLIYHDSSDNHITAVTDFYDVEANRTLTDLATSNVSDNTVIIPNNRNVHIGTGNASANLVLWVGYISHALFNGFTTNDSFSGAGLDDMTGSLAGYTGTANIGFEVEIDATGTPDTFRWRTNGGGYTSAVAITGGAQALSGGVTVTFGATTGHTLNDKWYITKYQVPSGLQTYEDKLINLGSETLTAVETTGSGTKYFKTSKAYQWAYSLMYDGYQESPLHGWVDDTPSADSEYYTLVLRANSAMWQVQDRNRVTGYNIYRRESEDLSTNAYGLFRKVYSIASTQDWTASGDDLTFTVLDYGLSAQHSTDEPVAWSATYEENSGIPETLEDAYVQYSLACKGNGFLFVGKCYHPSIEEASQCIFKSKSKRFSMFDWTTDILRLPRVPTAMAFYLGRLYAFDVNNVYVINPDLMVIEDIFQGAGAKGQRSVCVTPYGMFFANDNNAFMFDGRELIAIGNRIKKSAITGSATGASWATLASSIADYIVLYEGIKGYVLFIGSVASTPAYEPRIWAYHIQNDRWDYWNIGAIIIDANSGAFTGKDGEIYYSNITQLVRLFAGASRQNFEWISQDITVDDPSLDKMWYDLIIDSNGAGTVTGTFGVEGAAPTTALTSTTKIQSGGEYIYAKSLRLKVATIGVKDVNAITIIARPLVGSRVY